MPLTELLFGIGFGLFFIVGGAIVYNVSVSLKQKKRRKR